MSVNAACSTSNRHASFDVKTRVKINNYSKIKGLGKPSRLQCSAEVQDSHMDVTHGQGSMLQTQQCQRRSHSPEMNSQAADTPSLKYKAPLSLYPQHPTLTEKFQTMLKDLSLLTGHYITAPCASDRSPISPPGSCASSQKALTASPSIKPFWPPCLFPSCLTCTILSPEIPNTQRGWCLFKQRPLLPF